MSDEVVQWAEGVCRVNPILFSEAAIGHQDDAKEFAAHRRMNQLSRELGAYMDAVTQTLANGMEERGDFDRVGELEFEITVKLQPIGTNKRYPVQDA